MLLVFEVVFLDPMISWIELYGMGGGWGGWGVEGALKQPFGLKEQWCAFIM